MAKNNKGFTLLEVILSVTVVSIISVFILEMFVASNRVNKRAFELDNANLVCMNAVEAFKGGGEPIMGVVYEEYFDRDWNRINDGSASLGDGTEYRLTVTVYPYEADIYKIDAVVSGAGEGAEIASLSASKYFGGAGGASHE